MKPLIGVTTYREQSRWGVWDEQADVLHAVYSRSIEAAGGVAVLLPPSDADAALSVVTRIDGLVIAGGADVDPWQYGAEPHERTAGWRLDRDTWELALLDAAWDARLPVLGICRGMQVMAVHGGGSLEQHVPDVVGHERALAGRRRVRRDRDVDVVPGTKLGRALGDKGVGARATTTSPYASTPGSSPRRMPPTARSRRWSDDDRPFWMAVQWHPETHRGRRALPRPRGCR